MNITPDGRSIFPGDEAFKLKAAHGVPLDFLLDIVINGAGIPVGWVGFVDEARRNGWWDYQTYESITHAMDEAGLPLEMKRGIQRGLQVYIMTNPQDEAAL